MKTKEQFAADIKRLAEIEEENDNILDFYNLRALALIGHSISKVYIYQDKVTVYYCGNGWENDADLDIKYFLLPLEEAKKQYEEDSVRFAKLQKEKYEREELEQEKLKYQALKAKFEPNIL